MGKVGTGFSMSLDGYVAGPNDDVTHVFAWMFKGDQAVTVSTGDEDINMKVDTQSAEMIQDTKNTIGVLVAGRHLFDVAGAWGGKHPMDVPIVVVTHRIPEEWANKEGSPFTFVTEGVEKAIEVAQKIAGDKMVSIASTTIAQQAIELGLLEQVHVDLVPVVLGGGTRLFADMMEPLQLEIDNVVNTPSVTHITYNVVK